jgi:hypothetical protein
MAAVCATVCDWLARMTEQRRLAAIVLADVAADGARREWQERRGGASPRCPRGHPKRPSPTPDERALLAGYFNAGAIE